MYAMSAGTSMIPKRGILTTVSNLERHLKTFLTTGSVQNVELEKIPSQSNRRWLGFSPSRMSDCEIRNALDAIYSQYNRREFLEPDPLQFLFKYNVLADREICALLASCLAYGRVAQIIRSVEDLLGRMGRSPRDFVEGNGVSSFSRVLRGFKHRFTDAEQISELLVNAKFAIHEYGSLEATFKHLLYDGGAYVDALEGFSAILNGNSRKANYLLPRPSSGSACKRLNLFMKWLVRKDDIDPGGWDGIDKSLLIIPLDTHMWQIATYFGFTKRRNPDFKAALEISQAFARINREDPCKYDFALTRLGIRRNLSAISQ